MRSVHHAVYVPLWTASCAATLVAVALTAHAASDTVPTIQCPQGASPQEVLAAREIRRYVYLRTGQLLPLVEHATKVPEGASAVVVAEKGRALAHAAAADPQLAVAVDKLVPQQYLLKTITQGDRRVLLICGGDGPGTLYGAYRFVEHLGVRFDLHEDVIPDERIPLEVPVLDESAAPLFELRGIQPFHDFPEGPDWWNVDDYLSVIGQIAKLRMNFIGLHTYPENGPNAEPTVWVGLPSDIGAGGAVKFSYPSSFYNTLRDTWGYTPRKTGEYLFGAADLFERDAFGADAMADACPEPQAAEACNAVFERTATMLRTVFEQAHRLGIKTCVGTETPLTIPKALRERLKAQGKNAADPAVVQELYEGIFRRAAQVHPLDYYWLWTSEGWGGSTAAEHIKRTADDMRLAYKALQNVGTPFRLATCGWTLGPQTDRAAWDHALPKDVPMSCINGEVGRTPVDAAFQSIVGRGKWAIPWLEDDPALTLPQLWVGRMRRDAMDALRYGCTGLMGIHWRTEVIGPNAEALARAGWDQRGWSTQEQLSGALNGAAGTTEVPIKAAEDATLYQSLRWGVSMYRVFVPNGTYKVTLKFCEYVFPKKGARVFDVCLQGKTVIEALDIFDKAGWATGLDYTFENIKVENGYVEVGFVGRVDNPTICAIAVEGPAATKKINCGGPAYKDYAADALLSTVFRPVDDFYLDWATARFGPSIGADAAAIFSKIDGKLPIIAGWVGGPGGIGGGLPWEQAKVQYAFVDEFEALRPRVKGAGNLARFDYWLNTFRYLRAIARMEATLSEYVGALNKAKAESTPDAQHQTAQSLALPLYRELVHSVGEIYGPLLATVNSPGALGTVTNWEQHIGTGLLREQAGELAKALGRALPVDAAPSKQYAGPARIIVPTVRTSVVAGETLKLKVILLAQAPAQEAALYWREMGRGEFARVPLVHVARGVYTVELPAAATASADLEYYIKAVWPGAEPVCFPPSAPALCQTVIVVPSGG